MADLLATILPIYLTYKREIASSVLNRLRRIFREAFILFPALFFMLKMDFLSYTFFFILFFIALNSIYEIGYVYNDWIRVKYDEKPTIRNYVKEINPPLAIALRATYMLPGLFFFPLSYVVALTLLSFAILNHNLRKRKIEKAVTLPFMRVIKYMFIPIAISGLDLEIVGSCLILLMPLFMIEGEIIAWDVINHYEKLKTSLRFPYYVWFLTFLPFQALLLLKYPIWVLSGELIFMLISGVRHK